MSFLSRSDDRGEHARVILDEMYQFVALLDVEGRLLHVNAAATTGGGIRLEEVLGRPFWEAHWWDVNPETKDRLKDAIVRAANGEFIRYEVDVYGADEGRELITIDFSLKPVRDAAGRVAYLLPEGRNITEKKRAEAEVERKTEELRALYERLRELLVAEGSRDEDLDDVPSLVPAANAERHLASTMLGLEARDVMQTPFSPHELVERVSRLLLHRSRSEEAMRRTQNLVRAILDGVDDSIFVKDLHGRYLLVNEVGAKRLGKTVEELLGKTNHELFGAERSRRPEETDRRAITEGRTLSYDTILDSPSGPRILQTSKGPYRDRHGRIVGVLGIARDVTEARRLEDEMREAQKMESIGSLAGGIAHDFNNLLTAIQGHVHYLEQALADDPIVEEVRGIRRVATEAGDLTHQLLAFARRQLVEPRVVSLDRTVGDAEPMLRRLIREDLELRLALSAPDARVDVDPTQLKQILVNLVVNARDAMPSGGHLTIRTRTVIATGGRLGAVHGPPFGTFHALVVSDTGTGMSDAVRARAFEPFFTTKEAGRGTGLGLATCYGIVKQLGGRIALESRLGIGTTVTILLPPATRPEATPTAIAEATGDRSQGRTILLVEDEFVLLMLAERVLRDEGYEVIAARDGLEALRKLGDETRHIDALVSDVVMPKLGGPELFRTLRRERPDLRALFVSGHAEEMLSKQGLEQGDYMLLTKPYLPGALLGKLRILLS